MLSKGDRDTLEKKNGIHWRMPAAMAVCWIIGLGLALGHHFYYFSLDGTIVPGQTQQEWSLRVGTGLAFLTKTFLTTSVGIACVQNFWWILRLKPVRLSTLDSMWDIRGNIFNFLDPHIWLRGPNVAILGLISCANVSQQVYDWARANYAYSTSFLGFTPDTDNISYAMHERIYTSYQGPDNGDRNADIAGKLIMTVSPYMPLDQRWVIECGIYNASYSVNFNFTNGVQSTEITGLEVLDRVRDHTQHEMPPPANEDQLFAYTAIMKAFRDVLEGRCVQSGSTCTDTKIYSTALVNSKQIWKLVYNDNKKVGNTTYDSLGSILDVASELGRNITLSFFGSPYFLNTSLGPLVNVTIHPNQTEYVYSQRNLLIAYGVSVFISLLCIIAGLITMWDNGIAFTDSLTTILRATRNPKFDEIVPADSTTGADPVPESLSNTRVLWVPAASPGAIPTVAGLKPLPSMAKLEKAANGNGTGNAGSESGLQALSPIRFSNRIPGWERKSYRPTISRVETETRDASPSPGGFI
ncbi:hypothetical protein BDW75DRAFT_231960 [Aspergillus navahoensis]